MAGIFDSVPIDRILMAGTCVSQSKPPMMADNVSNIANTGPWMNDSEMLVMGYLVIEFFFAISSSNRKSA
jgi:hypothetical protein